MTEIAPADARNDESKQLLSPVTEEQNYDKDAKPPQPPPPLPANSPYFTVPLELDRVYTVGAVALEQPASTENPTTKTAPATHAVDARTKTYWLQNVTIQRPKFIHLPLSDAIRITFVPPPPRPVSNSSEKSREKEERKRGAGRGNDKPNETTN